MISLSLLSDPIGDYSFAYIITKRGSRMVVRGVANYGSNCACWGDNTLRGSNPLRGSIAFIKHCMMLFVVLKFLECKCLFMLSLDSSHFLLVLDSIETLLSGIDCST